MNNSDILQILSNLTPSWRDTLSSRHTDILRDRIFDIIAKDDSVKKYIQTALSDNKITITTSVLKNYLPPIAVEIIQKTLMTRMYLFEKSDGSLYWRQGKGSRQELKEFLRFIDIDVLHRQSLNRKVWTQIFNVDQNYFDIQINKSSPSIIQLNSFLKHLEDMIVNYDEII